MKAGNAHDADHLAARLHRIEGQVRGITRMAAEETDCIDVLTQVNAIKAALDQVSLLLIENHIRGCLLDAVRDCNMEKIDELVGAVARFARA